MLYKKASLLTTCVAIVLVIGSITVFALLTGIRELN